MFSGSKLLAFLWLAGVDRRTGRDCNRRLPSGSRPFRPAARLHGGIEPVLGPAGRCGSDVGGATGWRTGWAYGIVVRAEARRLLGDIDGAAKDYNMALNASDEPGIEQRALDGLEAIDRPIEEI